MRSLFVICAVLVIAALTQSAILAQGAPSQTKWQQLPDMKNGMQFSSETKVPSIVADDWLCVDGNPVVGITWWGGYWIPNTPGNYAYYSDSLPTTNPPATYAQAFNITIWSDIPADPAKGIYYSMPGQPLKTYTGVVPTLSYYGATSQQGRLVYQYTLDISNDPFLQDKGTIYWISIVSTNLDNRNLQWGWHESNNHWNDAAVQDFKGSGWYALENNLYKNDMAFELRTIPEPSGLIALASGVIGIAGIIIRRRQS